MKLNFTRILSFVLMSAIILSSNLVTVKANEDLKSAPVTVVEEEDSVTFSNLDSLEPGESIEYAITDSYGNMATIGLERVTNDQEAAAVSNDGAVIWKVSYTGVVIKCSFYMNVSENKVTSVYDKSITVIGGTYEGATLTHTSTYGKLTFDCKAVLGIASSTCWLKATVTGTDNAITVTHQM